MWRLVFRAVVLQLAFVVTQTGSGLAQSCLSDPTQYLHVETVLTTPGSASGVALTASHAYVADATDGLQIADISNPASPSIVGAVDTPGSARGVAVAGTHAYVCDGTPGLQVIDVSNPAMPVILTTVDTPDNARDVVVSGNYAFVADGASGVQVIDISVPASATIADSFETSIYPTDLVLSGSYLFVGGFGGLLVLDATNPRTLTLVGSLAIVAEYIAVDGDQAYAVTSDQLQVITISDPANPVLAVSFDLGGDAYYGVAVQGDHAFVVAQLGLVTVDVSVPTSPSLAGIVRVANDAGGIGPSPTVAVMGDHAFRAAGDLGVIDITQPVSPPALGVTAMTGSGDVALIGNLACVAAGTDAGLQVVDVSNPAAPSLLGTVDTPGDARAVATTGSFACVADGAEGLQVISLANPSAPVVVANVPTGFVVDVAIAGTHAYALGPSRLDIVDVSSPTSPAVLGHVLNGLVIADHEVTWNSVTVSEPYAYIISGSWLNVVDVSNPAAPNTVTTFSQGDTDSDLAMQGSFTYQVDISHGHFTVTDVSDPLNPTVASKMLFAFFGATSVAVRGSYAYVTLLEARGLNVLDISNPTSPQFAWSAVLPYGGSGVAAVGDLVYVSTGPSSGLDPDEPDFRIFPAQCDAATAVGEDLDRTPHLSLASAWPNPFRTETTVRYEAPSTAALRLQVYDVLGRRVRDLTRTAHGRFGVATWDGTDDRGRRMARGVYVLRLSTPGGIATRRVTLLR